MATKINSAYIDLKGREFVLNGLERGERELVERCIRFAKDNPQWPDYANWWMHEVTKYYEPLGLSRREIIKTIGYRIGQDLQGRQMLAMGVARPSDYRDEIEELIRDHFPTQREFCEATGLSEDMLSHVLAKRKHLAVDTLSDALAKIGYALHIAPLPEVQ
jgi:hypothetical protein